MLINDENGLGRIKVSTIPLPNTIKVVSATYTYSGKVLIQYKTEKDLTIKDFFNIAIVDDDGNNFKNIFSGFIKKHKKSNGIRLLPFEDNKRVLLGDYILECYPDIDNCQNVKLLRLTYPWFIRYDPYIMLLWSEVIISPDNEHVVWTTLRFNSGSANFLGTLKRKKDKYVIINTHIISDIVSFKKDKKNKDYIIPQIIRGGEVKQFVRGGKAITLVGSMGGGISDSTLEDLETGEVMQITNTPGYNETTIFSPDEKLGIVMSTRGSKKTDPAIFCFLPRPYYRYYVTSLIVFPIYMYAVAGVRYFREGNIGPVLIEIEKSVNQESYQGVLLNDPEEKWVYVSPMSWHPSSKKAMFLEMMRGSFDRETGLPQLRVRKVELLDYKPSKIVQPTRTPDNISYSTKGFRAIIKYLFPPKMSGSFKIAGKYSGYIEYIRRQEKGQKAFLKGEAELKYINFSDDGKRFYNGIEKVNYSYMGETMYEADVKMTGEEEGEMKLRATFSKIYGDTPSRLLFEKAEDGKPKSYGYVKYKGITLNIEDLLP
ncbi:MAG TPA: hypothetical protein PLK41_07150 [Defluviitoga tunisiensis]|nr:hypothetical protein [Defluviitoga tunisiensis]